MNARQQEKKFPKAYAAELMRIANGDLLSAEALHQAKSGRPENVWYLVQQAIEKALKAVLCSREVPIPLVHDLGVLVAKLSALIDIPFGYELSALNEFATIRRYEEGQMVLSDEETLGLLEQGKAILKWCEQTTLALIP